MKQITNESIEKVIEVTSLMHEIRYIPTRKIQLAKIVDTLSESEKSALAFFMWFCLWNTKFKAIEPSKYNFIPLPEKNRSTFVEFILMIRSYEGINITPSRELRLIKFIGSCDKLHRDFYLSVMAKEWHNIFPMYEVQNLLPIESITAEAVYGKIEILKTEFSDLCYPVVVRAIPAGDYSFSVISKEPNRTLYHIKDDLSFRKVQVPEWAALDLTLSSSPRYTIAGWSNGHDLYPFDYFDSWEDCSNYLDGGYTICVADRVFKLNSFLRRNMLVNTSCSRVEVVFSEAELKSAITNVMDSSYADILITDSNSLRSGNVSRVSCRTAVGKIEDIWQEKGEPLGFIIWFNGEKVTCSYKFEGKEQALLSNIQAVKGVLVEFHLLNVGTVEYRFGKHLKWGAADWRQKCLRGTDIHILGCALCGDIKWPHANRGLCHSCESNLPYYFKKHGPNVWIKPSQQMTSKRWKASWKCSNLNKVNYKHQGCILEANESGYWIFRKD